MKKLFPALLLFISHFSFGQKENNIWCFGNHVGIDFNTGPPTSFSGAATNQAEGSASIADTNGNLLFYTDGVTVWGKNHLAMPNGTGLLGNWSTSQSALIIPKPGSATLYYIFTLPQYTTNAGLNYSVIDMSMNSGLGDVTQKNIPINSGQRYSERLIGIRQTNDSDFWVIVHTFSGDQFHVYSLNASGIIATPIISTVGQSYGTTDQVGTMHCTLNGDKIATAFYGSLSGFELFDFDRTTGILSNSHPLKSINYKYAYSVCFSPSGRFLYGGCCDSKKIFQFDLLAAIIKDTLIATAPYRVGDMQLGPDSLIYISMDGASNVGAIINPDATGAGSNFNPYFIALNSGSCQLGINNYVYPSEEQKQPVPIANFTSADTFICFSSCIPFNNLSSNAISYEWTFPGGDPSSSTLTDPTNICYNNPGKYDVQLIAINGNIRDTMLRNNYITVKLPTTAGIISALRDTICSGTPASLSVAGNTDTVHWQSSVTSTNFITISGAESTTYIEIPSQTTYYRVFAGGDQCADTSAAYKIVVNPSPVAKYSYDTAELKITFNSDSSSGDVTAYNWDFGDSTTNILPNPVHTFSRADTFQVCLTVFNGSNCSFTTCKDVKVDIGTHAQFAIPNPQFAIFPNPANESFRISLDKHQQGTIRIYNCLGQLLYKNEINSEQIISTADLLPGNYYITFQTDVTLEAKKLAVIH